MSTVNEEIDHMAEVMEKSTETPQEQLFKTLKDLGAEAIKAKLVAKSEDGQPLLSTDEKIVLKGALEEMKKAASPSMDANYQANYVQGNIVDTIIQEDKADDDQDEKLVQASNSGVKHQGDNAPEKFEGQVIKAKDPIDIADDADETADESVGKVKKTDGKKPKVMGKTYDMEKNYGMKKSKEDLLEMKKSIEAEMTKAGEEITPDLVKAKMKKLLKEESQNEDKLDDMQNETTRGSKENPDATNSGKDNKAAQDNVNKLNQGKMKKSVDWADKNHLLKARTGGRNHHFSINDYYDDVLAKAEGPKEEPKETLAKSEGSKEETEVAKTLDSNDYIEKSMDCTQDEVMCDARLLINKAQIEGTFTKSFQDNEIAQALGLSEEEAKKILGE